MHSRLFWLVSEKIYFAQHEKNNEVRTSRRALYK